MGKSPENIEEMNYPVKILPEALKDLEEALVFYESVSIKVKDKFLNELDKLIKLIADFPEIFPAKRKHYREALMKKFPFVIIYTFDGTQVTVYAVFHVRRAPESKPG